MDKLWMYALSALLLVGVGAAVIECSSASCGNGVKEGDEQCDNGPTNGQSGSTCSASCQLMGIPKAALQVSFTLLTTENALFRGSTCKDLGVSQWRLQLAGPTPDDQTLDCLQPSKSYASVEPGTYIATITLLDMNGQPVTNAVTTQMKTAQLEQTVILNYDFMQADFLRQNYMGALNFDTYWGAQGVGCAAANPAVTRESLKLTRHSDGMQVAGMTIGGLKLDGTYGACATNEPQQVMGQLPWGHYDLTVLGEDAGAAVAYCKAFDIFVGPGTATGIYPLVIDAASTDGGACP